MRHLVTEQEKLGEKMPLNFAYEVPPQNFNNEQSYASTSPYVIMACRYALPYRITCQAAHAFTSTPTF
jgi:hypothetical protein